MTDIKRSIQILLMNLVFHTIQNFEIRLLTDNFKLSVSFWSFLAIHPVMLFANLDLLLRKRNLE